MKTDHLDPRRAEEDLKLKVLQAISAALAAGERFLAVDLQTGEITARAGGGWRLAMITEDATP